MLEFIKMFGLGILYTILFPLIMAVFALSLVYVFCNYIVNECIHFFGFFFGYTFSVETELEKKLREIKEGNKKAEEFVENSEVSYAYSEDSNEVVLEEKGSDSDELY